MENEEYIKSMEAKSVSPPESTANSVSRLKAKHWLTGLFLTNFKTILSAAIGGGAVFSYLEYHRKSLNDQIFRQTAALEIRNQMQDTLLNVIEVETNQEIKPRQKVEYLQFSRENLLVMEQKLADLEGRKPEAEKYSVVAPKAPTSLKIEMMEASPSPPRSPTALESSEDQ